MSLPTLAVVFVTAVSRKSSSVGKAAARFDLDDRAERDTLFVVRAREEVRTTWDAAERETTD